MSRAVKKLTSCLELQRYAGYKGTKPDVIILLTFALYII